MSTSTTSPEVDAYVAAVRAELADLPEAERAELLEDLGLHLVEVAADDDGSAGLEARLGPPAAYAAELRAAAGVAAQSAPPRRTDVADTFEMLRQSRVARAAASAWQGERAAAVRAFLPELRPGWWVLRGYLAVAVLALRGSNPYDDFPIPTVMGDPVLGLVATGVAIVVSVRIGRRRFEGVGTLGVAAANALIVVASAGLLLQGGDRWSSTQFINVDQGPAYELMSPHGPVTNIRPYAHDGTPLEGVLLFDQDGRPLRTAHQGWWPDGCPRVVESPQAADGVAVDFSYPHRYVSAPGTMCAGEVVAPGVPLPTFASTTTTTTTPPASSPPPSAATPSTPSSAEDAPQPSG